MLQRKDGTLVVHPECDGTNPVVIQNLRCSVSMASLLVADFFLVEGDYVRATVQAMNGIDYSLPSNLSG
jgi:hypothetical protein